MSDRVPLLGVSACLIRDRQVLLVRRGRPPFKGCYSLPGGRVAFGEPLAAAVAREIREETGLSNLALSFRRFHEALDGPAGIHAVIAVFSGRVPADAVAVAGDDAAEVAFFDPGALADLEAAGRTTAGLAAIVQAMLPNVDPVAQTPQVETDRVEFPPTPC